MANFYSLIIASLALLVFQTQGAPIPLELVDNKLEFLPWPFFASNSNDTQGHFIFSCRSISTYRMVAKNESDFSFIVRMVRGCLEDEWEQEIAKYLKANKPEGIQTVTNAPTTTTRQPQPSSASLPIKYTIRTYDKPERSAYFSANTTAWIGVFVLFVLLCMTIIFSIHLVLKRRKLMAKADMIRSFKNSMRPKARSNDYI